MQNFTLHFTSLSIGFIMGLFNKNKKVFISTYILKNLLVSYLILSPLIQTIFEPSQNIDTLASTLESTFNTDNLYNQIKLNDYELTANDINICYIKDNVVDIKNNSRIHHENDMQSENNTDLDYKQIVCEFIDNSNIDYSIFDYYIFNNSLIDRYFIIHYTRYLNYHNLDIGCQLMQVMLLFYSIGYNYTYVDTFHIFIFRLTLYVVGFVLHYKFVIKN